MAGKKQTAPKDVDGIKDPLFELLSKIEAEEKARPEATVLVADDGIPTFDQLVELERFEVDGVWRVWEEIGYDAPTSEEIAAAKAAKRAPRGKPRAEILIASMRNAIERKAELLEKWMKEKAVTNPDDVPEEAQKQIWLLAQVGTAFRDIRGSFFAGKTFGPDLFLELNKLVRFRVFYWNLIARRLTLRDIADAALGKV